MAHPEAVAMSAQRQEATRALNELRGALDALGIVLPSLNLDAVTFAASDNGSDRLPLIELGRVNLETTEMLTRALHRGDVR